MKKIFIFLMTIIGISMVCSTKVNAEGFSFYEGDYINGIYMTKAKGGTKYYQKARFFMLKNYNRFAYCVEPFAMFNESGTYKRSTSLNYLNDKQMDRIKKIAYFGYTYGSHYDPKWYAVAQLMIWREVDPSGDIYFTDSLNGNRISAYEAEINEINSLINSYETVPSFSGSTYDLVEGKDLRIVDQNNVLDHYKFDDTTHISRDGNGLILHDLEEGEYNFSLTRKDIMTTSIPFFYQSDNSQDMTTIGDLNPITISFKVMVKKTSIEIVKVDADTNETKPSGDASLSGAIYTIFDSNMNALGDIEIDDDMKGIYPNLDYGKYYIKEKAAGRGYEVDDNIYSFEITKDESNVRMILKNRVIKKKIEISKKFGDGESSSLESGIGFDIINSKGDLVDTIVTDSNGYASIVLPFGKYTIKQRNTTPGYKMIDDMDINVEDNKDEMIELYDYKIKVPNTHIDSKGSILNILILLGVLLVKKVFYI